MSVIVLWTAAPVRLQHYLSLALPTLNLYQPVCNVSLTSSHPPHVCHHVNSGCTGWSPTFPEAAVQARAQKS